MDITDENYLMHYGILRRSGRYPWGSGHTQSARNRTFLDTVDDLRKNHGMSEVQIAKSFGLTTTQLRAAKSIATNEQRAAKISQAEYLKNTKGLSNQAIADKMGINESSVRALLAPGVKDRADIQNSVANMLRDEVAKKTYIDVGEGVGERIGITGTKLRNSVAILEEEGYTVHPVQVPQVQGRNKTTVKVLGPPGSTYRDKKAAIHDIQQIGAFSDDGGRTMLGIHPPLSVDPKRIKVLWKEEGGAENDGVMYIRPGVKDLSIGDNRYAQVRVKVGDTHYLKGMAIVNDRMPPGVDIVFHSPKSNTGNKLDAMKSLKDDESNPFGSTIRQIIEHDANGKPRVTSAMNMVGSQTKEGSGAEGSWDTWSKSLSTQLLSKQSPKLAQAQLDMTYERKRNELEAIKSLTNPTVRKELLEKFATGADSSAVHLKAAALPRQTNSVLLPINSLKKNEIYAPKFRNGEQVALVRYPHGGPFEIPVLTVNNGNREARRLLGPNAKDAVAIHHSVAEKLSGADFDGDTVIVIPNNHGHIKSEPSLKGLEKFDAKARYPKYPGMPIMSERTKGIEMGKVSNLITDMNLKGAPPDELARAVRHSMVVIDAQKHELNYRQSEKDNGIRQLYEKYQKPGGGASTLISRATSEQRDVPDFKLRSPKDGGPIDPKTGKLVFRKEPEGFVNREGKFVVKTKSVEKLANTDDAHTLVGDKSNKMELIYAEHSNRLKGLANEARKEVAVFKPPRLNPSAKTAYKDEIASLNQKLIDARKNKPLERQAQIIANRNVAMLKEANPHMDKDDLKKAKTQALIGARIRTGAQRHQIRPTEKEWAAIQAGAISYSQLRQILQNADIDHIRQLATPASHHQMSPAKTALAKQLLAQDFTQAEVADHLGVSVSALSQALQ